MMRPFDKCRIYMDYLTLWLSFEGINMLNYLIYIPISTITLGFCLFGNTCRMTF